MGNFVPNQDFKLEDVAGVPSDGTTNTSYQKDSVYGVSTDDGNGNPVFQYPVGSFNGNSGFLWGMQTVAIPIPQYGNYNPTANASGGGTMAAKSAVVPSKTTKYIVIAVVAVVVVAGGVAAYKHFHKKK